MPTYNFSSVTAAQALALTVNDTLEIDQGSANTTTVLFGATTTSLTVGPTTVAFGSALARATITFADGSRLFVGTASDDGPAAFGDENNGLYGGAGADTLNGGGGLNQLQGNQGDDSLVGGSGYDVIYGGQDSDRIVVVSSAGGGINFAQGNRGDDTISGGVVDHDTLLGGQGNDVIGATDPGIPRRSGIFTFYEQPTGLSVGGNDIINGNLGDDVIFAGNGNDTISGEDGRDYIADTGGRNLIDGGPGTDFIKVNGETTVNAGDGEDAVALEDGVFVVNLGANNDTCFAFGVGGANRATIDGGEGRDLIRGCDGSDSINGGAAGDVIAGWYGADTLAGGDGVDEFDFFGGQDSTVFGEIDVILDWNSADIFYFQDFATAEPVGPGVGFSYMEGFAADYDAALAFANGHIAARSINYVVVSVGADLYLFVDSRLNDGVADTAVRLVGRNLDDIAASNFFTG